MRKLFSISFLSIISVAFISCSNSVEKCQYKKMIKISYNLNKQAASLIMGIDTTTGCYSITKHDNLTDLKDSENKFRIIIKTNPNSFEITDGDKSRILKEERGFKLGNKMSGDTLVLQYLPTTETPESILKFGTEYKFYN